jgi:hypothetical protein
MTLKMKKVVRILGIVLVVLAAGVATTALVAKHWIIPGIIASKIQSAAAGQWDGEVTVGSVEFSYSGPIIVRNINFRDLAKRPWLHVGSAELALRNWPGVSPVLTDVDVREVAVTTHFVNGQLDLPPRKEVRPSPGVSKSVDIQKITVRDISYTTVDDQEHSAKWAIQQFDVAKQPSGVFQVSLTSPPADAKALADGEKIVTLTGSIDPNTHDADLTLDGDVSIDASRTADMLRAMKVPVIRGIEGRLHIDRANLRGRLDDPGLWQLAGQINLKGFQFEGPYGHLAQGLDCTMELSGRTIQITQFSANGCGGMVKVSGQADIGSDWNVTYTGMLDASNVDVPKLTETVAGPDRKAQRGILSLQLKYSGVGGGIRGSGLLGLDKADVMPMSVFAEIFKQMGLGSSDQLRTSDVRAVFAFDGPRLTIEHGRLANTLSAIDVEKGGRVNVQTRELDLYVIAVPLKAVESILKLPIIGPLSEPFRNLRDKLVRMHIQGDWSAPPDTIVKKEPVTDVSEGTVAFFKDVAKSGGTLGEGTMKAVNDVFRALSGG